jgi:acetylornithine deacetylase
MDTDPNLYVETALAGDPVGVAQLLVSTPSVNPVLAAGGAGEAGMAAVTAELLEAWGFTVQVTEVEPGRPNVVARLEGSGPTLLLNGHLDTVGIDGMSIDPFSATIEDGRLMGRGSCDMKAGVAALMAAGCRLAARGPRPNLVIALTADEEHGSIGMADLVASGAHSADMAVVCEPTSLKVMPAHKGFVWIEATFRGRAAHGSRPDIGIDAIRHAALYVAALDGLADRLRSRVAHPLLQYGSLHAGTISGGSAESVYPDRCSLLLERRTMPGETPEEIIEEFEQVLEELRSTEPGLDAALEMTMARPGTEVPTGSDLVQGLLSAGSSLGVPPVVEGMTAWVDAAFLNEAGVPAVCYGPGSIEQAHTEDEWVAIDEIRTCADVLEQFARELVSSDGRV